MSAQKNQLTIVITLAIVSVLLLGGVSFTFFPTQTKPTSTPQLTISSNSINPAYVPAAVNPSFQIIGGYAFFGGYTVNSSLSSANNEPVGGLVFAVSDNSQRLDEITIGPDGSINSTKAPIRRVGDTYTLAADIINQAIVIQKDNIVLDGAGFTLGGFGHGYFSYAFEAIDLQGVQNVTVENFAITSFWRPIQAHNSFNLHINSNNLTDCPSVAITFDSVNNSVIANNFLAGTVDLWGNGGSQNNTIAGNTLSNIAEGIQIYGSNGNTITGNTLINVYDSIGVSGNSTEISNNIIVNSIGGIAAGGDATVFGNFISNITDIGLIISDQNNRIYENNVENAEVAVWMQASGINDSRNTVFYHNNFVSNTQDVLSDASAAAAQWDNGKMSNFWSSYNGTDTNKDGVGDTAFQLDGNNSDLFPLMQPYVGIVNSYDHASAQLFFALAGVIAAGDVFLALTWVYFGKRTSKKKMSPIRKL